MLTLEKVFKDSRQLKSLIGLSLEEFETLLPLFGKSLLEEQSSKPRKRAVGGGCKGLLPDTRHKLFYMKVYPTFDVAAFIFGTVRSVTFDWKSRLLPLLERALGRVITLPKRQITSVEEFFRLFPGVKDVFIDGTERPIQRPRKSKSLKKRYSSIFIANYSVLAGMHLFLSGISFLERF